MSGYKRVNFYELCRLCATNQQKDKTHIFQEEGRKIQLQNKIQSCLSLTVCENDFLPKVVCSKCLRTLEVCYSFRQECVSSESMLSSYFKNFRYTEDFKKSGKVYIKDTATKCTVPQFQQSTEIVTSTPTSVVNTNTFATVNEVKPMEHVPFYTLQLPAIVTNQPIDNKVVKTESKILQNTTNQVQGQVGYNLNTINLAAIKAIPKVGTNEGLSNVVVNANGEVINIAQLVDFESIINQANLQKIKVNNNKPGKKDKEEPIIKIDLTNSEVDGNYDTGQAKFDKLPHIKNNNQNKFAYAIKVEDNKVNPSVIFNNLSEFNQNSFNGYSNTNLYSPNLMNTNGSNNLVTAPNIICNSAVEPSTVNLNVLNQDLNQQSQNFTRNLPNNGFATNIIANQQSKVVGNLPGGGAGEDLQNSQVNNQIIKTHVCEICQKSFKRREHLYQHVKLHTGFRPYTCENCNKSFMRKEHLLRHMTSHSGQKNFTCNICDKSFSRNDNLLKHKKTHDKQASYTCDICQKQFVMKHYYLAHKLTHDGDRCSLANVWNVLKT
ncbi:zf-AD domain containing protein [Asbolus verrucosus]|uniref:Zf-AD domain containing protein n=1 Tax=Asbolus verrucosus TaxID=1661398 RepID=A0A482W620_ASBVE|nr:zf-AD domain containing protein [Asbolus verrucosus]